MLYKSLCDNFRIHPTLQLELDEAIIVAIKHQKAVKIARKDSRNTLLSWKFWEKWMSHLYFKIYLVHFIFSCGVLAQSFCILSLSFPFYRSLYLSSDYIISLAFIFDYSSFYYVYYRLWTHQRFQITTQDPMHDHRSLASLDKVFFIDTTFYVFEFEDT